MTVAPPTPLTRGAATRRPVSARLTWILVAIVVALVAALASIAFGARVIGWDDLVGGLLGTGDGGIYTTVADVHALWAALDSGRIVPKARVAPARSEIEPADSIRPANISV